MDIILRTLNTLSSAGLWPFAADMLIRSSITLAVTLLVVACWRRASAAQRHLALSAGCFAAIAIPVIHLLVPAWHVPLIASPDAAHAITVPLLVHDGASGPIPLYANSSLSTPRLEHPWIALAVLVWGAGCATVFVRFWRSHRYVQSLINASTPVVDARILAIASKVQAALRIEPHVALMHAPAAIPMAVGFRNPSVLLPWEATQWSQDQLHDILVHEIAHIQRADSLTQMLASAMCAVYWFNPLTWIVTHELREQRERACDDQVLAAGRKPSAYATNLLEFARRVPRSTSLTLTALTFARTRRIERRLRAIIASHRTRTLVGRRGYLASGITTLGVSVPMAIFTPSAAPMEAQPGTTPWEIVATDVPFMYLAEPDVSTSTLEIPASLQAALSDRPRLTNIAQSGMPRHWLPDSVVADSTPKRPPLLTLLDGREVARSTLQQLSPDAIKRIEILTGPDAVKLYGQRAAGGVMLVSTLRPPSSTADSTPDRPPLLTLLDGREVERSVLQKLSPETIERIEILTGPGAGNLYGQRAAGGVMLITLRQPGSTRDSTGRTTTDSLKLPGRDSASPRSVLDEIVITGTKLRPARSPAEPVSRSTSVVPGRKSVLNEVIVGETITADGKADSRSTKKKNNQ